MKFTTLPILLLSACCCTPLFGEKSIEHNRADRKVFPETSPGDAVSDTVVWLTGVEVRDGYDWRRDTSAGQFEASVILYRNYVPYMKMAAGPGTMAGVDHDLMYYTGGHLFTYGTPDGKSILQCDGRTVWSSVRRETLKGLLCRKGAVHSLSESMDGHLLYRINDTVAFESAGASAFGSLIDCSYPESGAIYACGDKVFFCYSNSVAGEKACYVAENGVPRQLVPGQHGLGIIDVKVTDGLVSYFALSGKMPYLVRHGVPTVITETFSGCTNGRIFTDRGPAAGILEAGGLTGIILENGNVAGMMPGPVTVCRGTGFPGRLRAEADGTLSAEDAAGRRHLIRDSCYLFSGRCAFASGDGNLWIALTPKARERKPYVWKNGDTTEIALNGYLTGITVEISPSR